MSENTSIEWCDATVNIWQGCAKYALGCENCYAEADLARWGFDVWGKLKPRLYCKDWEAKLRALNRKAARLGRRLKVFINSESDFFEDHRGAVINRAKQVLLIDPSSRQIGEPGGELLRIADLRRQAFDVFDQVKNLDLLLVTKRPENIPAMWCSHVNTDGCPPSQLHRRNVWLGASFSDEETLDRVSPALNKCRALSPVLFLSGEPILKPLLQYSLYGHLLTPIQNCEFADPDDRCCTHDRNSTPECHVGACPLPGVREPIDWVILGGESGPNARPCDVAWLRQLVADCKLAEVPVFVKQLGSNCVAKWDDPAIASLAQHGRATPETVQLGPVFNIYGVPDDPTLGRIRFKHMKAGDPAEWPADLRVRQFPKVAGGVPC